MYKVVLRRHDDATLRSLVDSKNPLEIENSSELVVEAYRYFRKQLNRPEADPGLVYRGVGHLNIVDVTLHRPIDDPQRVFESLNSTGVDLTQSDLIRNYLLMGLPEPEQPGCTMTTGAKSSRFSAWQGAPRTPSCGTLLL